MHCLLLTLGNTTAVPVHDPEITLRIYHVLIGCHGVPVRCIHVTAGSPWIALEVKPEVELSFRVPFLGCFSPPMQSFLFIFDHPTATVIKVFNVV